MRVTFANPPLCAHLPREARATRDVTFGDVTTAFERGSFCQISRIFTVNLNCFSKTGVVAPAHEIYTKNLTHAHFGEAALPSSVVVKMAALHFVDDAMQGTCCSIYTFQLQVQ
jgi:hypothetical protein